MLMANTFLFKIRRPHQFELMKIPVILFGWLRGQKKSQRDPKTINFRTIIISVYSLL